MAYRIGGFVVKRRTAGLDTVETISLQKTPGLMIEEILLETNGWREEFGEYPPSRTERHASILGGDGAVSFP